MTAYWRHTYHLVWATHYRQPTITDAVELHLHAYLEQKATELGYVVYAVNGMADHVHLVLGIPPQVSVSTAVQKLKGSSSHYVNTFLALAGEQFKWQEGFGSLTVSERLRERAVRYVQGQKQHHAEGTTYRGLEECGEQSRDSEP